MTWPYGDTLLRFNQEWPPRLNVNPDTKIWVGKNTYVIQSTNNPKQVILGGEIVNRDTGERVFIADLLRDQIPENDPRWTTEKPELNFDNWTEEVE